MSYRSTGGLRIGGSLFLAGAVSAARGNGKLNHQESPSLGPTRIGRYESGLYDEGGAEISAYDPKGVPLLVVGNEVGGTTTVSEVGV